jgi:DNA-binding response OmpR family regulator
MEKRILLVDDESSLRRSLTMGLNQRGIAVENCETGLCALNKLESFQQEEVELDSVVLDILLPDINGVELGKMIKEKYPNTPVIFITGYADKVRNEIDTLGAAQLLEKPFTIDDLAEKFNEVLDLPDTAQIVEKPEKEKDAISKSAFMMVKLNRDADFFKVYRELYFMDNVLYCDATQGDYDIILLVHADTIDQCQEILDNKVSKIEGVDEVDFMKIGAVPGDDKIKEIVKNADITMQEDKVKERNFSQHVCSYVLVELEKDKLEKIHSVLDSEENVAFCDVTTGKYNLVLMVHGSYFTEVDRFVENKIIGLNGVLKVKKYPVVNMFEM